MGRHQAGRRGDAHRPVGQGDAHPGEGPLGRPDHGRHRHRHRALPLLHPPPLRREDAVRRGVQGPCVALSGRGEHGRAAVRRRWQEVLKSYPDNFRLDYALSREQTNKNGGKMYIQDKVAEYSDEIFTRMDNGAHMYFCGLKGMMPGITTMLEDVSKAKGIVWEEKLKEWKKAGQWHVEVY